MRIDNIVTSGIFSLDGEDFEVDNNVWIIGDENEVLIIDAAHNAVAILDGVGDRRVRAIICTHGHNDHINAAAAVADATGAPIWIHPEDTMFWEVEYPDRPADGDLTDGQAIDIGAFALTVAHTPGHSPGAVCLVGDGVVFGGDTLFEGGPGATGRSYSSKPLIIESINNRLMTLPLDTVIHTGHGPSTTIGAEADNIQ